MSAPTSPNRRWPRQAELDAFYGNPRDKRDPSRASAAWERTFIVGVDKLPFTIRYDGRPVPAIRCHRLVAPALREALEQIWRSADQDQRTIDQWGVSTFAGSYVYRLKRGLNTLSCHAYGVAFDFDPVRNSLRDRTPHFAGIAPVLAAWRSVGAQWGGDWDGDGSTADEPRCDGMHWQFARL